MEIRKTRPEDLETVLAIYEHARGIMKRTGNPTQWGDNRPDLSLITGDIENGTGYVITEDGAIRGVFAFIEGADPSYEYIEDGAWLNDEPYGTIHRVASDEHAHGILAEAVKFCREKVDELRIDTHHDNAIMRHLIEKLGFTYCGVIYVDDGTPRVAYQMHTNRAKA